MADRQLRKNVINNLGLRSVCTPDIFRPPAAIRRLVQYMRVASAGTLTFCRVPRGIEGQGMARKWFRPHIIQMIGVTAIVEPDMVDNLHY